MSELLRKKLRFYLRLSYPQQVVAEDGGFRARLPDLPGCELCDTDLQRLYGNLERLRRAWITKQLLAGADVPIPNARVCAELMSLETAA